VVPTDVVGAYNSAQQAALAQYNALMQQIAATAGGLFRPSGLLLGVGGLYALSGLQKR